MPEPSVDRESWRLLPYERTLWQGRRVPWVARDRVWTVVPALLTCTAFIFLAFAGLLWAAGISGAVQGLSIAFLVLLLATGVALAPRFLQDPCEYLVTDQRVIWRRGWMKRSIEIAGLTYGRIHWHRSASGVGHLELVRAVPFGPLARKQRLMLLDVRAPDVVFATIRGHAPPQSAGAGDVPLVERLDPGETLLWGGRPQGWLIGWREVATAALGAVVVALGSSYGYRAAGMLASLENLGLSVRSWTWVFFFVAIGVTWGLITSVGLGLLWHGLIRSRNLGRQTDYILTDLRLLIRRGRTELSIDRRWIVDVAVSRSAHGLRHLFLMLDSPGSRALAVSGALGRLPPSRDDVPPVLYEIREVDKVTRLILGPRAGPGPTPVQDAA